MAGVLQLMVFHPLKMTCDEVLDKVIFNAGSRMWHPGSCDW